MEKQIMMQASASDKTVLILCDYVARTGFGTVSKNIIGELKRAFGPTLKKTIIAVNYFGEPFWEDEHTLVLSAKKNDFKQDDFGRYFFLKTLKENEYDGIFICQDVGVITPFIEVIQHIKNEKKENNKKSFKSIFYFPIDCKIIKQLVKDLEFFDVIVTYTEYGRKEVLRFKPELKSRIRVVPHGNNSKHFYPMPDEEKLDFRKEFFGENAGKFIITNVNRNQPRKDIPNTIFGFIEAKNNWDSTIPPPFLYLHCHPNDPMGWDIRAIMFQTDLEEDIDYKLLPKEYEESGAPVDLVNKVYNASDVFLTTTLGEGWGLTYSEAAACKLPVIAPYTTSFMEMSGYGERAYMLETIYPICQTIDNAIREQTDIYEVSDKILQVAKDIKNNSKELQSKVNKNYEWVRGLEWTSVCKIWVEYFKQTFSL
jgi:glycosyltransferase involved in cell wall biosynthesis